MNEMNGYERVHNLKDNVMNERTKGRPRKQDTQRIKLLEAQLKQQVHFVFDRTEINLLHEALLHYAQHLNKEFFDSLNELPKNTPFRDDLEEKQESLKNLYSRITFRD